MKKRIVIIITFLLIFLIFIINSFANSNKLTINYEKNDTKFRVYNMKDFEIYNIDYNVKDVTTFLVSLIAKDNISPRYTGYVKDSKLEFKNIEDGYYLIVGENYADNNVKYTLMPTLMKINKSVEITPKYEKEVIKPFNLSVVKSWIDNKNSHDPIKVSLYENGVKIQTVELSSKNNFRYTFENLNRKNEYTVFEDEVPSGYRMNIVRDGDTFTVINSSVTPPPPPDKKLPQTGLLQWPILYLLILGAICIILSFIKYRKFFLSAALVAIVVAIILFLNNETESLEGQNSTNIAVNEILKSLPSGQTNITREITTIAEIPEMPVIEIDGIEYIGTLEIPSQDALLSVTSDWSMDNLKVSPCRYAGSIYTDDLVICGHNYTNKRHFGLLKDVQIDDTIIFRDVENNIVEYRVVELETLGAYDVSEMIDSEYDLTLFTCTYSGKDRLVIRANRFIN